MKHGFAGSGTPRVNLRDWLTHLARIPESWDWRGGDLHWPPLFSRDDRAPLADSTEPDHECHELAPCLEKPSLIRCGSCGEVTGWGSWRQLIQRTFQSDPLRCPVCEARLVPAGSVSKRGLGAAIVRHLEARGAEAPFAPFDTDDY